MTTYDFITTDADELFAHIDTAHRRFAALVQALEPDTRAGAWDVRDTAAHLVTVVNRYNDFAPDRLADRPRGVDLINQRELDMLPDATVDECLTRLDDELHRLIDRWGPGTGIPLDLTLPFHGGGSIDYQSAMTNVIGEFLVHGHDLAGARGVPWAIDDRHAALLCGLLTQLAPAYVRPERVGDAAVDIHIEGLSPWRLRADEGSVRSSVAFDDGEASVLVETPPTAMVLFGYSRLDATGACARGMRVDGWPATALDGLWEAP